MRLVGPYPFIAHGNVQLRAHRSPEKITIIVIDTSGSVLDEVSFSLIARSEADMDAYEEAVVAFNKAFALAKAREAA